MTATRPGEAFARKLAVVASRLKVIHGTALAVQMALQHQNAESDIEFAECLRHGVCAAVFDQSLVVASLAKRAGASVPEVAV